MARERGVRGRRCSQRAMGSAAQAASALQAGAAWIPMSCMLCKLSTPPWLPARPAANPGAPGTRSCRGTARRYQSSAPCTAPAPSYPAPYEQWQARRAVCEAFCSGAQAKAGGGKPRRRRTLARWPGAGAPPAAAHQPSTSLRGPRKFSHLILYSAPPIAAPQYMQPKTHAKTGHRSASCSSRRSPIAGSGGQRVGWADGEGSDQSHFFAKFYFRDEQATRRSNIHESTCLQSGW